VPISLRPLCFVLCALPVWWAAETLAQSGDGRAWHRYADSQGTSFDFPSEVFVESGNGTESSKRWITADGQAVLSVFTLRNTQNATPARFLKQRMRTNHQRFITCGWRDTSLRPRATAVTRSFISDAISPRTGAHFIASIWHIQPKRSVPGTIR
jgi:hypothetical protein